VEFVFVALVIAVLVTLGYSVRQLARPAPSFPSMRDSGHDHSDHNDRDQDNEENLRESHGSGLDAQAS
jgi:hypothetical protein